MEAAAHPDVPEPEQVEPEPESEDVREEVAAAAAPTPTTPWEVVVHQSMTTYQPTGDGGMILKFIPGIQGPGGRFMPMPPAIVIVFGAAGWERHKREVAADGEKPPEIQTATILPAGIARPSG